MCVGCRIESELVKDGNRSDQAILGVCFERRKRRNIYRAYCIGDILIVSHAIFQGVIVAVVHGIIIYVQVISFREFDLKGALEESIVFQV